MPKLTAAERAALKPGDRVWISLYGDDRKRLTTVLRLTPALVLVGGGLRSETFSIVTGCCRFADFRTHLNFRATAEEVREWEADKRREADERQERERQRQAILDRGIALSALFAAPAWVGHEVVQNCLPLDTFWNIYSLTEEQVRLCAAVLKTAEDTNI
jgi:hypothetical protein